MCRSKVLSRWSCCPASQVFGCAAFALNRTSKVYFLVAAAVPAAMAAWPAASAALPAAVAAFSAWSADSFDFAAEVALSFTAVSNFEGWPTDFSSNLNAAMEPAIVAVPPPWVDLAIDLAAPISIAKRQKLILSFSASTLSRL